MNNIAFVHIINENLGDAACCPKRQFSEFRNCPEMDYRRLLGGVNRRPWTLIVGGGGLLHPGIDVWIEERAKAQRVILWGIGLNYHDGFLVPNWRNLISKCALITLRDKSETTIGGPIHYCPCVSCMSPEFDAFRDLKPKHSVVCFEHYQKRLGFSLPTRSNQRRPNWGFAEAIRFLASGRRVITNSFHGGYWAALLGRPVLIYQPFSMRFRSGLRCRDFASKPEEIREWLTEDVADPPRSYLEECRDVNRATYNAVRTLLAES
jgi:hypothetical protein